jgi:hypothetical protein
VRFAATKIGVNFRLAQKRRKVEESHHQERARSTTRPKREETSKVTAVFWKKFLRIRLRNFSGNLPNDELTTHLHFDKPEKTSRNYLDVGKSENASVYGFHTCSIINRLRAEAFSPILAASQIFSGQYTSMLRKNKTLWSDLEDLKRHHSVLTSH